MKLHAFIIDTPVNSAVLRLLLKECCPYVEVKGEARSVEEYLYTANSHDIQLLFLDVETEEQSGIRLQGPETGFGPYIIYTTVYDEFAIRTFRKETTNYLLRPIGEDDLMPLVEKVRDYFQAASPALHAYPDQQGNYRPATPSLPFSLRYQ